MTESSKGKEREKGANTPPSADNTAKPNYAAASEKSPFEDAFWRRVGWQSSVAFVLALLLIGFGWFEDWILVPGTWEHYLFYGGIATWASVFLGNIVIYSLVKCCWSAVKRDAESKDRDKTDYFLPTTVWPIPLFLGSIERLLFMISIAIGKPEFVAVWFILRSIHNFKPENKTEEKYQRSTFGIFFMAMGAAVLFGFIGALILHTNDVRLAL